MIAAMVTAVAPLAAHGQHHRGGGGGGVGFVSPLGLGFGFGLGYGYGYGLGFNYRSNQVGYINQQALQNGSRASMGPVEHRFYAESPAAYYNHTREVGLIERYDIGARREEEARVGRFSDGPPPSRVRRERLAQLAREREKRVAQPPLPTPQTETPIASATNVHATSVPGAAQQVPGKPANTSEPNNADHPAK